MNLPQRSTDIAPLELALFGGFQARVEDESIDVPGRKERALLAYLAMAPGEPRSRDRLCALLWGDRGAKQARDALKQALYRLRLAFEPVLSLPVLADRTRLTLDRDAVGVDVQRFEQWIGDGTPEALERATALYRGELLEGLEICEAGFEEWLLIERQRLHSLLIDAQTALLDRHMAGREHDKAIAIARRTLALDPLQESAHRALMLVYADQGHTAQALKQYRHCCMALQGELGVEPEAATRQLYQSIMRRCTKTPENRRDSAMDVAIAKYRPASPPTIAVLPFVDLSGGHHDGNAGAITEDIITDLSRWPVPVVLLADAPAMGAELRAHFLVKGNVRRIGERIRISVRLIDTQTGYHLWAERFDRAAAELPSAQDEVARTIVGTIAGRVLVTETERACRKPRSELDAHDLLLRANALSWDDPTTAAQAKRAFERAIEIDPGYGRPYGLLATMLGREWRDNASGSLALLDRAFALAQCGVEMAGNDSTCHTALGYIHLERRDFDKALRHMERGVEINPANPWNQVDLGYLLSYIGRAGAAVETFQSARDADPYIGPPWYWRSLGVAQFALRRYAEALECLERGAANSPGYALAMMAGCCAKLGFTERARRLMARCLARQQEGSFDALVKKVPFKDAADREHLAACLRSVRFAK